jgi:atypical dual specificity phosphatase
LGTGGKFLRELRAKVEDRPTGFVWVGGRMLAGTGFPASRSQVEWLSRNGVRSVLSLTEEPLPERWLAGLDVKYGHVPMKDHEPPSVDSLRTAVTFLLEQKAAGRPAAVHCLAGEGRTGCVLAAFLIRTEGLGADQAIAAIRAKKPAFVERNQESAVHEFAAAERE